VLPRWEGLVRYCEDGCQAIDNNISGQMIRPCAIGRKTQKLLAIVMAFCNDAAATQN
jgi:hypothetical protein